MDSKIKVPDSVRVKDCSATIGLPRALLSAAGKTGWDIMRELASVNGEPIVMKFVDEHNFGVYRDHVTVDMGLIA